LLYERKIVILLLILATACSSEDNIEWLQIYPSMIPIHAFSITDSCFSSKFLMEPLPSRCWTLENDTIITSRGGIFGTIKTITASEIIIITPGLDPNYLKYIPINPTDPPISDSTIMDLLLSNSWTINNGRFNDQLYFTSQRIYPDSIANDAYRAFRHRISPDDTSGFNDDMIECSWFVATLNGNPIIGITYWHYFHYQLFKVLSFNENYITVLRLNEYDFGFMAQIDSTAFYPSSDAFDKVENLTAQALAEKSQIIEGEYNLSNTGTLSGSGGNINYEEYNKIPQDSVLVSIVFRNSKFEFKYSDGFIVEGEYHLSPDGAFIVLNDGTERNDYVKVDWEELSIEMETKHRKDKWSRYYPYEDRKRKIHH